MVEAPRRKATEFRDEKALTQALTPFRCWVASGVSGRARRPSTPVGYGVNNNILTCQAGTFHQSFAHAKAVADSEKHLRGRAVEFRHRSL